jgi:fructan beta-fructosidase
MCLPFTASLVSATTAQPPPPGLMLWLDAADSSTLDIDPRGVGQWRDKSGRNHHLEQAQHAARPALATVAQNGHLPVGFDGARQFLQGPAVLPAGQAAYTIVAVWRPRVASGAQSVFEQAATPLAGNTRAALLAVGDAYGFNGESNDRHDLVRFEPGVWRLTCMAIDNARERNVAISDNGVGHSARSGNPQALNLGTGGVTVGRKLATDGEYLNGEVAEILVFDHVLSRSEQGVLLAHLDAKWGLDCLGWFRSAQDEPLAFDFDGDSYEGWTAEGTAFGDAPARGTLPNQMDVTGFLGGGLVNSYLGGDGSTGRLTSPPFVLERRFVQFLIGGGKYPGQTCLNLIVDGDVVRTATGPNDAPGGSERLDWMQWDVADLRGKTAVLQILDEATGGWGHINVDHIIQTDRKLPALLDQTREIVAEGRYLNLPVKNGAPKRRMTVVCEGAVVRDFVIPLADAEPDYWVFMDLVPFRGNALTLRVERLPEDSRALAAMEQGDAIRGGEDLYREALRPQFHFTTRRGWNNDPNGLVYHAGEWHLFYQHNPYSIQWDNMHWGHAVSRDLVHWEEQPVALYPDALGPCFSGSAVVDEADTAGFATGEEKPIVCVYTAAGNPCVQCLEYSNDRGRTWTKYAGNPVLPHIIGGNRDPKVIWYGPQRKWVMALFLDGNDFGLFGSPDLKQWERLCTVTVPGAGECPEFFEIPVEGRADETRWVFYGGNGLYLLGRFDGRTFTPESGPHALNHGNCFYASQTFNGAPDGRRIQIAWGTMGMPGMPFNQQMDFPVELTLRETEEGLRLFAVPAREIALLHEGGTQKTDVVLRPGENPLGDFRAELLHLRAEFEMGESRALGLVVRGTPITYDVAAQQVSCRDRTVGMKPENGRIRLEVLVDRTTIEIFGNDGRVYMPMGIISPPDNGSVEVFAREGAAVLRAFEAWPLKSIW